MTASSKVDAQAITVAATTFVTTSSISITTPAVGTTPSSPSMTASFESGGTTITEWYRGMKVNKNWLVENNPCLQIFVSKVGNRNRPMMKCIMCESHEHEARKYSANGSVPMAIGVAIYNNERLKRVIDHIKSRSHLAAVALHVKEEQWKIQSNKHPWVHCLKKHRADVIDVLIRLAVDVYNDSILETPTARSWPARSLAQMHGNYLCEYFTQYGWEAPFKSFDFIDKGSSGLYHYRDPVKYHEMLEIIASLEIKKIGEQLQKCISFSVQIDGSVNRQQIDSKFVVIRYMSDTADVKVETKFIRAIEPEKNGAHGLLEALLNGLKSVNAPLHKLVGVCTDGEAANTGKNGGLWSLLIKELNRDVMTIWCVCHRSDLALEAVEEHVGELSMWKANLKSLATFFHVSKRRNKLLQSCAEGEKVIHFPRFFQVRFTKHLKQLIEAANHNMPFCRQVRERLQTNGDTAKERSEVQGMLQTWKCGGMQL